MRSPPADLRAYYLQRTPPTIDGLQTQSYFPSLELLFPSIIDQSKGSPTLAAKEIAVDVSHGVAIIEDLQTKTQRTVQAWIRKTHLVEPINVMSGEYVIPRDGALPTFRKAWQLALRKLNDPYNEAYTGSIFACMASRLVETGRSPHFCRFYGTFNGRVPEYRYNITDDMSEIEGRNWFSEGLQSGAFRIVASDPYDPDVTAELTRPWEDLRPRLFNYSSTSSASSTSDDADDECDEVEAEAEAEAEVDVELMEADIEVSGTAVVNRSQIRLARLNGDRYSRSGHSSSTDDDEIEYHAILKDFPVQMTVLELCDGTMDDLMEDEISEEATEDMRETKEQRWTAWIFQVIAALTTAQQHFDMVHNDLHTNNVMWSGTGETHLYYHISGAAGGDRFYRVPTFGRIMKLIDFGRATFRLAKDSRTWFPDVYAPHADAGGQYNCGPYFDTSKPKVVPNKSFDLCRLAVAMLETLWEKTMEPVSPRRVLTKESGRTQAETTSPLWNLLWLWLTDKDGKNVLRSPDGSERYPQFDLYCAIARDVHNAVPAQQLTLPLFDSTFRCRRKDIPSDATIWKLQATVKAS